VEVIDIEQLIIDTAEEYGVDPQKALAVARCESNLEVDVQSYHLRPDGSREQSYGLWQIFLPAHPTVTREMAIDPEWSTRWAMEHLKEDRWSMWTCSKITGALPK